MTHFLQTLTEMTQTAAYPFLPDCWDHLPDLPAPMLPACPLALGLFFCAWPTSAGQPHSLLRSLSQGTCEFLPSRLPGLFIQTRDLREQPISTSTNAGGLHRHIPATLLFIQPTRASDASADAALDQDGAFPAGNGGTHIDTPLIVA